MKTIDAFIVMMYITTYCIAGAHVPIEYLLPLAIVHLVLIIMTIFKSVLDIDG